MKPAFRVIADGADITAKIAERLLSIRITDEAGITSDQAEISLDDRGGEISLPPTGAELSVSLGYENGMMYNLGKYSVDEVEISGPPRSMTVRGKAADMKASLKSWRKADYHKTTLGKILTAIAHRHGLKPAIASEFSDIAVDHLDQTYESDLHIITRLAEQHGAVAKPAGGSLLFVKRAAGVDAGGKPLPPVAIPGRQIIDWRAAVRDRQFYARVGAHYKDKRAARVTYVYSGDGEPVMYLRHPYKSQRDALAAAEAKLRQLKRGRTSLSLSIVGNPMICAEMPIIVSGFRDGVDGEWIVTRAEHTLDGGGLTTRLEAQRRDDFAIDPSGSESG